MIKRIVGLFFVFLIIFACDHNNINDDTNYTEENNDSEEIFYPSDAWGLWYYTESYQGAVWVTANSPITEDNNLPGEYFPTLTYDAINGTMTGSFGKLIRQSTPSSFSLSGKVSDALSDLTASKKGINDLGNINIILKGISNPETTAEIIMDETTGEFTITSVNPFETFEITPSNNAGAYTPTILTSPMAGTNVGSVFVTDYDHMFKCQVKSASDLSIFKPGYISDYSTGTQTYSNPYVIADDEIYTVVVIVENQGAETSPATLVNITSDTLIDGIETQILAQIQPSKYAGFYVDIHCSPSDITEWREFHTINIEIPDTSVTESWNETLTIPIYKEFYYLKTASDGKSDGKLIDSIGNCYTLDSYYTNHRIKLPKGLAYSVVPVSNTSPSNYYYGYRYSSSNDSFDMILSEVILNEEATGAPDNTFETQRQLTEDVAFFGYKDGTADIDILFIDAKF